jgi:hypothetical protein
MKIGDLVEVVSGYHSLENHNNPPPNGSIALIISKESLSHAKGCTYTILIGEQKWSNVFGSRLRLIKEAK